MWDPHTQSDINKLEKIQRRGARFVLRRYHNTSSVDDMINSLGWTSLQDRRKLARLSMLYKIRHGAVSVENIKAKLQNPPARQRRGHDQQYSQIRCKTQYQQFSFLPRTIKEWNTLSQQTVEASTIDTFVSRASKAVGCSQQ